MVHYIVKSGKVNYNLPLYGTLLVKSGKVNYIVTFIWYALSQEWKGKLYSNLNMVRS
jgi:hypothetical protein